MTGYGRSPIGGKGWPPDTIEEPRLLARIQDVLGNQVRALRHAPWDPAEREDPWSRVGVPVTPFPRWVRCPRCHRLGPLDPPGQFELVHQYGRRPDLAKIVHARCPKQANTRDGNKRACVPARFLVVCEDGHADEFPYVEFVHRGKTTPCDGPQLTIRDASSTLGPRVIVTCTECQTSRNIHETAGRAGWEKLPACRGRHPHLQWFSPCGKPLRLIVLGASNLWFGVTASALHLPQGQDIEGLVTAGWHILGAQPSADVAQSIIDGMDALRGLRAFPIEEVWSCIEKIRATGGPRPEERRDLLDAEWQLLSRPTTDRSDDDFRAIPADTPRDMTGCWTRWCWCPGCVRSGHCSASPGWPPPSAESWSRVRRVPLARSAPTWVPAVEQRGEGIFLQLREDLVCGRGVVRGRVAL